MIEGNVACPPRSVGAVPGWHWCPGESHRRQRRWRVAAPIRSAGHGTDVDSLRANCRRCLTGPCRSSPSNAAAELGFSESPADASARRVCAGQPAAMQERAGRPRAGSGGQLETEVTSARCRSVMGKEEQILRRCRRQVGLDPNERLVQIGRHPQRMRFLPTRPDDRSSIKSEPIRIGAVRANSVGIRSKSFPS